MEKAWEGLMNANGYLLEGIFANLLHTNLFNKDIILHATEPILYFGKTPK